MHVACRQPVTPCAFYSVVINLGLAWMEGVQVQNSLTETPLEQLLLSPYSACTLFLAGCVVLRYGAVSVSVLSSGSGMSFSSQAQVSPNSMDLFSTAVF